jgi:secondary thiamine-phosphate synthase enzyme
MKWVQAGSLGEPWREGGTFRVASERVELRTEKPLQIIDITELVEERVRRSQVAEGLVSVQSLHTTAAVVSNENEPRLLRDFERLLGRLAPEDDHYEHDDLEARWPRPAPDERKNGHAHCRALLLGGSLALNVSGGRVDLGGWQRIFLVELDGPRPRTISIHVLGTTR